MKQNKLFIVDPMSYSNLALYDKFLIENIEINEKVLIGNVKYEHEDSSNFEVKLIYNYSDLKGVLKFLSYIKSQIWLIFLIFLKKPKVIHFQWLKVPQLDYFVLKIIKLVNSKSLIVLTAHNILPHDTGNKYKKIYYKIYNLVDEILVHDDFTRDEMIKLFFLNDKNISVVPHGLLNLNDSLQKKRFKEDDVIVFSMLGFLNNYKGIELLVDAWLSSDSLSTNNKIKLVIAGKASKEMTSELAKLQCVLNVEVIQEFIDADKFNELMTNTDVLLLPYTRISQSGLLLMGLTYRKAVLVSRVGGLTQPFQFGKVGWVLKELTSKELMGQLEHIIENSNDIKTITEDIELWKRIDEFYCWKNIAIQTKELYFKGLKNIN
jgi:glycosyltransferase involved in cell wall biosynthesis